MNTLNAFIFTASVLSSASVNATLADEPKPSKIAAPVTLSGENFIEGSVQNTLEHLSSSSNALGDDVSTLGKTSMAHGEYGVESSDANRETRASATSYNPLTVPNTLGMLLAGAGMIGFMVARRR